MSEKNVCSKCGHNLEKQQIKADLSDLSEAFLKIWPDFNDLSLIQRLKTTTNEENKKFYHDMMEMLTRSKVDGGYAYCNECSQKAIEIFCAKIPT